MQLESQMLYPEYPSYGNIESRIKSFASGWIYPSGSRLSNQMMAEAGFFNMGEGSVCCYYCGNKLQKFEPRYFHLYLSQLQSKLLVHL